MRLLLLLCLACAILSSPHGSWFAMADCITHTVQQGDTCWSIWTAYGLSEAEFRGYNPGIDCDNLYVGQLVCVTNPSAPPAPTGPCTTYTVQQGDTCWSIWTAYGLTEAEFRSYNPGLDCNNLWVGQEVCVSAPGTSPPSPPPPPSPPSPPPPPPSDYNGKVFMEYIGARWVQVQFTDVPINTEVDFYFILSFAIDYTVNPVKPTNGDFAAYWDYVTLTPTAVNAIKASYSNVKVMLSLGGDTVSGVPVLFTPTSTSSWVANAVSSLTTLINQYNLDGIDIDYEHFNASTAIFTECIGQLITQLKQNGVISVATIAPYPLVDSYYEALFNQYSNVIDYVNYQFYAFQALTQSEYVAAYNKAAAQYGGGSKLLASFNTNTNPPIGTPPPVVLNASQELQGNGRLPGIFVWSADNSKEAGTFTYEEQAQALLASASSSHQLSFVA